MPCYKPITAHQAVNKNKQNRAIISFKERNEFATFQVQLPCGQCIGCRLDRSITWAARCMHEAQMHDQSQFITLTYETLPNSIGSLHPPDFRNFIKRYRIELNRDIPEYLDDDKEIENPAFTKIRYYHGAEYGEPPEQRPHHHACIFGHQFSDREIWDESEGIITYTSKKLSEIWGLGFVTTQDLTIGNAAYCARYAMKKVTASQQSQEKYHAYYERYCPITGEIKTLQPEYSTMSRQPGIGKDWYEKFNSDIFPHDTTIYKGKKIKTPRYYEQLLREADETTYDAVKAQRKKSALLHGADNTPRRLKARERVKTLTYEQLKRKI